MERSNWTSENAMGLVAQDGAYFRVLQAHDDGDSLVIDACELIRSPSSFFSSEQLCLDNLIAARNLKELLISTVRYERKRAYSPVWGAPLYVADTRIFEHGHALWSSNPWKLLKVITYKSTVEAVDGHRGVVKRARQSRRRKRM